MTSWCADGSVFMQQPDQHLTLQESGGTAGNLLIRHNRLYRYAELPQMRGIRQLNATGVVGQVCLASKLGTTRDRHVPCLVSRVQINTDAVRVH